MDASAVPARLENFPVSFFSVVMGLTGLTIATQRVEGLFGWPAVVSTSALVLTVAAFVAITAAYSLKLVRHRDRCAREFNDPVKISFFPAFSIALILLAIAFLPVSEPVSFGLWVAGAVVHLVLTLVVITVWVQQPKFEIHHMNPVWFLPVVGNILVPIVGVEHAPTEISWFFFSVGLVFWTILQGLFFYRIFFHHPLPAKLLPTFFILLAPPAVGFVAYVRLDGVDNFARVLYHYGLFLFLLLLAQMGMLRRTKFFLSWWAYSFPVAALAIASVLMYHETGTGVFRVIALVVYAGLLAIIGTLAVLTVRSMARKEICVEE